MARKPRNSEQAFGSDAFLDVIANIVGILIILMVIAGVKVSRAPVFTRHIDPPPVVDVPAEPEFPAVIIDAAPQVADLGQSAAWPSAFLPAPIPETIEEPEPIRPPPPEVRPPADLVEQSRMLTAFVSDVQQRIAAAERQYAELNQLHQGMQADVAAHESSLATRRITLAGEASRLEQMHAALLETESQLSDLRYSLDEESQQDPDVEVLEHHLTPVARMVTQREVHFRLADGKVSYVPIEELAALVQQDIQRQRDLLIKLRYYNGSVGPEEGYRMQYVVQQQDMSLLDELRVGGANVVRVGVTQWLLEPQPGLDGETADEALQDGSRFLRILRRHPGATLTFWVYPDSFETHQALNSFVREAGFEVAARPLPEGVPIAGSPNGSRSVAQ
jgi:hypothetical protein